MAKRLVEDGGLAHFDLDAIAWLPTEPPQRSPTSTSQKLIQQFMSEHDAWVIEGCYADLIEFTLERATELIFLDLAVEDCIRNARRRPWEPHKYESKESQDANLEMLIGWIADYPQRDDSCSRPAHQDLFERFSGRKTRMTELTHRPRK